MSDGKHCPNLVRDSSFFVAHEEPTAACRWNENFIELATLKELKASGGKGSLGKNYESFNPTNTLRTPAMEPENEPFPKENHHPSLHIWVPDVCFHGCVIERKGPSKRDDFK